MRLIRYLTIITCTVVCSDHQDFLAALLMPASLFGVVVMCPFRDPVLAFLWGEWAEVVCLWTAVPVMPTAGLNITMFPLGKLGGPLFTSTEFLICC